MMTNDPHFGDARVRQEGGRTDRSSDDRDSPAVRPRETYVDRTVELRLRGTPAQIAVQIRDLSNRVLRESGYLPFAFNLPTNFRDPTIKTEFPSDKNEIRGIMVYPMDHGRPSEDGETLVLSQANLGWIDLVMGPRDNYGDVTFLRFTCNRLDWSRYEKRLEQLSDELRRYGFLEDATVELLPRLESEIDFDELEAIKAELRTRRGRKRTPQDYKLAVVAGAKEADRRGQSQSAYCDFVLSPRDPTTSLSVSTLREWQKDRDIIIRIFQIKNQLGSQKFEEFCKLCYINVIEKQRVRPAGTRAVSKS